MCVYTISVACVCACVCVGTDVCGGALLGTCYN